MGHGSDDDLGDAFAAFGVEGLGGEVDEGDFDLAAVVAVDGAGRVDHGDAVLEGQAAARSDLALEPRGDGGDEAGGHEAALEGGEGDGFVGVEVAAGGAGGHGRGQGERLASGG